MKPAHSYRVTDAHTGATVGTYATLRAAHRAADRRDAAYGAVRFTVSRIPAWRSAEAFFATTEETCHD